jgi:hypothetical protein
MPLVTLASRVGCSQGFVHKIYIHLVASSCFRCPRKAHLLLKLEKQLKLTIEMFILNSDWGDILYQFARPEDICKFFGLCKRAWVVRVVRERHFLVSLSRPVLLTSHRYVSPQKLPTNDC